MRTQCCQPVFGSPQCNDCPLTVPLYPIYRQPAPSQTGTPRTDAFYEGDNATMVSWLEFARQLERELAEAKGSLSRARAGETLQRKAADTAELALSQAKRDAERPISEELVSRIFSVFGITDYPMNRRIMRELIQSAALAKREGEG